MAAVILISSIFVGCSQVKEENETQQTTELESTLTTTKPTTEITTESTTESTTAETTAKASEVETTKKTAKPSKNESVFVSSDTAKTAADKFYQDAVFIGDSVSMGLRNRATSKKKFPGAKYLVRQSFGSGHAIKGTMLLTYQGKEMSPENAVKATGAKKVFIMFGMNDLNIYGVKGSADNMMTLISRILKKSPDAEIYIQSMTPIVTGAEVNKLNNTSIDEYNALLKSYAAKYGYHYLDVATNLKDSNNGLRPNFSSDNYVHLSSSGLDVWIATLEAYAEAQTKLEAPETTTKAPEPTETTTKAPEKETTTKAPEPTETTTKALETTETTTKAPESTETTTIVPEVTETTTRLYPTIIIP